MGERENEAEEVFLSWIMDGPNQTKPNLTLSVTFSLVGEEIRRNCPLLYFFKAIFFLFSLGTKQDKKT